MNIAFSFFILLCNGFKFFQWTGENQQNTCFLNSPGSRWELHSSHCEPRKTSKFKVLVLTILGAKQEPETTLLSPRFSRAARSRIGSSNTNKHFVVLGQGGQSLDGAEFVPRPVGFPQCKRLLLRGWTQNLQSPFRRLSIGPQVTAVSAKSFLNC